MRSLQPLARRSQLFQHFPRRRGTRQQVGNFPVARRRQLAVEVILKVAIQRIVEFLGRR
ncbi:hypothetical protein J8C07_13550 [Chloracidobacterium sp. S]|uniref:hypothetical protein n=1 Tax=Chloracidobacterium aggregatum TaxID=2851959 RepID=UPI001B8B561D|nr:hypothetical protein [Chloracidobacterium aggregatum]QUV89678.1 hypothetical protein J8C07_13550 [Chloracidobacterium sp. S]